MYNLKIASYEPKHVADSVSITKNCVLTAVYRYFCKRYVATEPATTLCALSNVSKGSWGSQAWRWGTATHILFRCNTIHLYPALHSKQGSHSQHNIRQPLINTVRISVGNCCVATSSKLHLNTIKLSWINKTDRTCGSRILALLSELRRKCTQIPYYLMVITSKTTHYNRNTSNQDDHLPKQYGNKNRKIAAMGSFKMCSLGYYKLQWPGVHKSWAPGRLGDSILCGGT